MFIWAEFIRGIPLINEEITAASRSLSGADNLTDVILTHPDNLIFGVQRDMKLRKTTEGKDAIEREPPKPWERLKLLAVCREVDKESGRVSVYPLDLEITSEILASLKMRAQFNPELRYFTTTTARWDRYGEVMAGILKRRTVSRADLDNIGGICEI